MSNNYNAAMTPSTLSKQRVYLNTYVVKIDVYLPNRYLLRFFDCLAHPNLSATFATDQKLPLSHLRISYQSLAGGLRSLQKSKFLKLIISLFHSSITFGAKIEISGTK